MIAGKTGALGGQAECGILTGEVATVIRSLEIQNLRGIHDGKLDELTPLVVLVGPNGSGKSTVLDALFIGANNDPKQAAKEVLSGIPGWTEGLVGLCG